MTLGSRAGRYGLSTSHFQKNDMIPFAVSTCSFKRNAIYAIDRTDQKPAELRKLKAGKGLETGFQALAEFNGFRQQAQVAKFFLPWTGAEIDPCAPGAFVHIKIA